MDARYEKSISIGGLCYGPLFGNKGVLRFALRRFAIGYICAFPAFFRCSAAVVYTVEGRLHYEEQFQGGKSDAKFTVCVSNCLWSITETPSDGGGTVFKQAYDGTIITSSAHFSPEYLKTSTATLDNDSTLGIEEHDTPYCLPSGMGQLWLAYASACKYAGATNGRMELVWFSSFELLKNRFKTPATWQNESSPPFVPRRVDFLFDMNSYQAALSNIPTPAPEQKSGTHAPLWASYRIAIYTNLGSLRLPRSFYYEQYDPMRETNGTPMLVYKYHGELLAVRMKVRKGDLDHGYGDKTLVEDNRSRVPVHYIVSNRLFAEKPAFSIPLGSSASRYGLHFYRTRVHVKTRSGSLVIPYHTIIAIATLLFLIPAAVMFLSRRRDGI